ncbi:MAG: hypothetical protein AAF206_02415 [Bacteroidota bacterium]
MSTVVDSHSRAMDLSERAFIEKMRGNTEKARAWFVEAYQLEKTAALNTPAHVQPSRSVLLRSAATLAFHGGLYREAEKLIGEALSEDLPAEIASELRELQREVGFHLQQALLPQASSRPIKVVGKMYQADASINAFRLSDKAGNPIPYQIQVEDEGFEDIIKEFFDDTVVVKGKVEEETNRIFLEEIKKKKKT